MELLKNLYMIQSLSCYEAEMRRFIIRVATCLKLSYREDKIGNLYVQKGEGPVFPCLCAHMDEVHSYRSDYRVEFEGDFIRGYSGEMRCGIGADDKNGIWVLLKCLAARDIPDLKCAFFVQEECGCQGSRAADMSFFRNCRFTIQVDRRFANQFITMNMGIPLCSGEFPEQLPLAKFGYAPAIGGHTDVCHLKLQGLAVCAANVSCGYYYPHSDMEETNIPDLQNCLALVREIILTCKGDYPHRLPRREEKA